MDPGRTNEFRSIESGIVCKATGVQPAGDYKVLLTSYCTMAERWDKGLMISTRGRMIVREDGTVLVYHEQSHGLEVGFAEDFEASTANKFLVSGFGHVISFHRRVVDAQHLMDYLFVLMRHYDYDSIVSFFH